MARPRSAIASAMTKPILIAGPTASGKSALAVAIAQRVGGVVINADSMQVYRELSVLTARPTPADTALVPHVLYGHVAGVEGYSAGRYVREASAAIEQARAEGRPAIVVGGTGLYFKALLDGLSPVPEVPPKVRARWRAQAKRVSAQALHHELTVRDPVMAQRLQTGDRQRVLRALEVIEATGRSLAEWHLKPAVPVLDAKQAHLLVAMPERDALYRRCDARFDVMMREGALDEVRRLMALRPTLDLPIMGALGVDPLAVHLAGHQSLEVAVTQAKAQTRQYAKRQLTWLRKHMMSWKLVNLEQNNVEDIIKDIKA